MAQLSNLSPGVRSLLRRAQAADIGGYGSIAQRNDPRNYGSIASRTYPGLFQQPDGDEEAAAQRQKLINNNEQLITLRRQQQYFANPQLYDQAARQRPLALLYRQSKILNPQASPNLGLGNYDGSDNEPDQDADE